MTVLQTRQPAWPFARFNQEQISHHALIIEWQKIADDKGYASWSAKLLYWDGQPRVAVVPATRVERVG